MRHALNDVLALGAMAQSRKVSVADLVLSSIVMLFSVLLWLIWVGYALACYIILYFEAAFSPNGTSSTFSYPYVMPSAFLFVVSVSAMPFVRGALLISALVLGHALLPGCLSSVAHVEGVPLTVPGIALWGFVALDVMWVSTAIVRLRSHAKSRRGQVTTEPPANPPAPSEATM
jgi:hypothetical protein